MVFKWVRGWTSGQRLAVKNFIEYTLGDDDFQTHFEITFLLSHVTFLFSGIQSLFFHVQMDMLCVWTVLKSTAQQNLMTDSLCTVILMGTLYLALEAQVRFYQTVFIKSVLYKNACFP